MSLINNMLRDLEIRRKHEERKKPASEMPIAVDPQNANHLNIWLYAGGFLLLGVLIWLGLKYVPETISTRSNVSTSTTPTLPLAPDDGLKQEAVVAEATAPVPALAPSTVELGSGSILAPIIPTVQNTNSELLSLRIDESDKAAQLTLSFTQLPEYRLLQNGVGTAQLVISFNQTQLGDNFDVPELTGGLLRRISLLPRQKTLQLLVDLDGRAQVQSSQLVETSDRKYQLIIDIAAVAPMLGGQENSQPAVAAEHAPLSIKVAEPKLNKSKNPVNRDQQAYQAGLEQLQLGNIAAAEANFIQALVANPQLLDARVQLIDMLLKQNMLSKAETQLRQGLAITPDNTQLRKQYARLLLNAQRYTEAIDLLKARPVPAIVQDLEYHALLAALFQETNQFDAAADLYGRLLQVRPEQAVWWLGLAIAMDQSEKFDQARSAYERALAIPGLRPDLQKYIQSRLQVL